MEIMAPGKSLVPLEQLKGMMAKSEGFSPEGLGVLVVDDDPLCLLILDRMLRMCKYNVTTCTRAMEALAFLREKREKFDLVISDVYMPDMDGFKLLELIGLEMDLPVIMMSADGETDVVMKGITHGACDYLLKPVRMEELRNIWQHVLRRRNSRDSTKDEASGEWDDNEKALEVYYDTDSGSQKRKERFEFDDQFDNINSMKKARVVWSFDLHQQFVNAVNMLGVDKAVPKRILEIMNVQGLTRENVASHLQKYRLYLKRLSGVNPQPLPVASFQASEGGHFKGSMHVQPGGRNTCASVGPKSTINSGLFGRSLGQLDVGTLTTLAQLQAFEQRQVARHGQRIEDYDPTMYMSQLTPIHTTSSNTEMVNIQELSGLQSESDILMKPHATVRPASIFEGDSPFRVADASSGAIPTFASNQAKDFRGDLISDNLTVMPNAPSNLATECNIDDLRDLTNLRSITQEHVTFVEGDTRSRSNQPARFAADIGASLAFSPANYHFNMGDVIDSGFGVGSDDFLLNIPPGVQGSILNTVFPCQEGKQVNHFL